MFMQTALQSELACGHPWVGPTGYWANCSLSIVKPHIDQAGVVSLSQVMQHRGLVQAGEVSHVFHFTEAWGVHPLHLLPGQCDAPLAVCQLDLHLIAALLPDTGRLGAEGGWAWIKTGREMRAVHQKMLWWNPAVNINADESSTSIRITYPKKPTGLYKELATELLKCIQCYCKDYSAACYRFSIFKDATS